MEKEEVDIEAKQIAKKLQYHEVSQRGYSIRIPRNLKFSLLWFFLFSIIGIIIQSFQAGEFIFVNFFTINYINWFKSFGNFIALVEHGSQEELFSSILSGWYYFFFTGGVIAVITNLIGFMLKIRISREFKRD